MSKSSHHQIIKLLCLMQAKTEGIVFRVVKYSESSVIATVYTKQFGLQTYIINGVRGKGKSTSKSSALQSLSILNMEVYKKENKNINRVKSFEPAVVFKEIPFDVVKSSVILFLAEVLNRSVQEEECNEPLYLFIRNAIVELDTEKTNADFHLHFLAGLTHHLGFTPHGNFSVATPEFNLMEGSFVNGISSINPHFLTNEISKLFSELFFQPTTLQLNKKNRKELLNALLEYYRLHVSNFNVLKSMSVIEQVFAEK